MSATTIDPRGPRWRGYLVARTAIMHGGANRLGNVVPFNTEPVAVPGHGVLQVPSVSGNSIRHQLREALAHLYLSMLRPIRVPPKLYYVLFSGGANQGGDGGHFDFDERRLLMRMVPPVAVFGTARDGGTYAGAVGVSSAQPVSRETWDLVQPSRPGDWWPCGAVAAQSLAERVWGQKSSSALRMLAERQYTRTDMLKGRSPGYLLGGADLAGAAAMQPAGPQSKPARGRGRGAGAPAEALGGAAPAPAARNTKALKDPPHQMIFSAQVLVRGIALAHELCFLQPADEVTRSAFGAAMEQWSRNPTIGGRAALGHGLVDPLYDSPFPDSGPFLEHVRSRRDEIRDYLHRVHDAVLDGGDAADTDTPADIQAGTPAPVTEDGGDAGVE